MGWSNQIPNPFIVGGVGVSGEIDIYDASGALIITMGATGILVQDAGVTHKIRISPNGVVNALPDIEFVSPNTPANDAASVVADDGGPSATAVIVSSTAYTNTVTGVSNRGVAQVAPNNTYLASRRTADGLYGGGYASAKDAAGEVGYATAGTAVTAVSCGASAVTVTGPIVAATNGVWQALTLTAAGWSGTVKYRLLASPANTLEIASGVLTVGSTGRGDGTVLGTLPVGYRPAAVNPDIAASCNATVSAGQTPHFNVGTNGQITMWGLSSASNASVNGLVALDL